MAAGWQGLLAMTMGWASAPLSVRGTWQLAAAQTCVDGAVSGQTYLDGVVEAETYLDGAVAGQTEPS